MERENNQAKANIILLGFMGSGKTVIGRQTARELNYEFADTDEEIKQVTGMELPQLFRKHGEIRFRSEEKLIITKLARKEQLVVACGGSLPPQRENLELLRQNGWLVLLSATPEVIKSRLNRKHDRLLVGGKPSPHQIAAETERWEREFADLIDYKLDSSVYDVEQATEHIISSFRQQNGNYGDNN